MGTFAASGKRLLPRTAVLADRGSTAASEARALPTGSLEDVGFEDEVTEEELLEFLAADLDPVPADPVFQEKLRDELWEMVEDGRAGRRSDH